MKAFKLLVRLLHTTKKDKEYQKLKKAQTGCPRKERIPAENIVLR